MTNDRPLREPRRPSELCGETPEPQVQDGFSPWRGQSIVLSNPPRTIGAQGTHQCRVNCKLSSPKQGQPVNDHFELLTSSTWGTARLRSLTSMFVVTLPPASRQILGAAFSTAQPSAHDAFTQTRSVLFLLGGRGGVGETTRCIGM